MPTLEELHNDYMRARDLENDYEAQQINEYCNTEDDIVELNHWKPVSDCIDDPEEIRWMPVAKKHIEENEDVDFNFLRYMRNKGLEK